MSYYTQIIAFMKWNRYFSTFFLVCLLVAAHSLVAQTADESRVNEALDKAKASFADPDSVLFYSERAYQLAAKINDRRLKAEAAKMMGVASHVNSKFDEAIPYYNESLDHFLALNDTLETGKNYLNLAITYNAKINYEETLRYALLSLAKFKEAKDQNGEGRAYNLLAIIYNNQGKYRLALNYFKEYTDLVIAVQDSVEIATAYNNLGATYHAFNMPDSAIYFLNLSKKIYDATGLEIRTGSTYQNLGDIYMEQGQLEKAHINYRLALPIHQQNNDSRLTAQAFLKIGETELAMKDYNSAEINLNRAIQTAKTINNTEVLFAGYGSLADAEAAQGKFSSAYQHLKLSSAFRDSLNKAQNNAVVQELQAKYETEQREQKIKDLNQQAAIQDLKIEQRNLFLVIALILLIGLSFTAYFIYSQRKQKEKQLILEAELQSERLKAEGERQLNGEKVRISRELHDNIGSYLTFIHSIVDTDELKTTTDGAKISQLRELTGETIRELRKTVWLINRNDVSLDEFGVKLREHFKTAKNLSLRISGDPARTVGSHQATELFRIIQEAVNNALKYSNATEINVVLSSEADGRLALEVQDNGTGFDPETSTAGFGLSNMKTRAKSLHADIEISSGPEGTLIRLIIPSDKYDQLRIDTGVINN